MPENGNYLFTSVGFSSNEEPFLLLQKDETFTSFNPTGNLLTLTFDITQRYCTGWKDISTGERFVCPTRQKNLPKYEQCSACQKRTGFNPAFYHASSVSPQQEARNSEPHILYLAHFGPGVVKVGISHAQRGVARMLEQGARSALILERSPTAHIARQYEAQIAKLPGIVETVQMRKKAEHMNRPYDSTTARWELQDTCATIQSTLGVTFNTQPVDAFDNHYFPNDTVDIQNAFSMTDQHAISGKAVGLLGSVLFSAQPDKFFYLPLKRYVGYRVLISDTVTKTDTPAQQISLF